MGDNFNMDSHRKVPLHFGYEMDLERKHRQEVTLTFAVWVAV